MFNIRLRYVEIAFSVQFCDNIWLYILHGTEDNSEQHCLGNIIDRVMDSAYVPECVRTLMHNRQVSLQKTHQMTSEAYRLKLGVSREMYIDGSISGFNMRLIDQFNPPRTFYLLH